MDWVEEKMFCPNNYAYSCLTKMRDGNMGLLYEHQNTIKFTAFNLDYIKDEVNLLSPTITSVTYKVEKTDDHAYTLPGDKYVITVTYQTVYFVKDRSECYGNRNTEIQVYVKRQRSLCELCIRRK